MKTNYCLCASVIFLIVSVGCATSDRPYSPSDLTGVKQVPSRATKTAYRKQSVSQNQVRNSASAAGDYIVKPGDTLYSVAFANNMDYQTLALINGIKAPYTINVGQRLLTDSVRSERKLYRVVKGDTVYNISKRYDLTPAQLASMNGIDKSFNIRIGQVLVVGKKTVNSSVQNVNQGRIASSQPVSASKQQTASKTTPEKRTGSSAPAMSLTSSGTAASSSAATGGKSSSASSSKYQNVARNHAKVNWRWPYNGKIVEGYSRNNKGIDISGNRGDSVRSAAKGKIVYAGNALRGYGNLIIINHDDDYLSAYAHNDAILVAEGQTVESGQVIARMGSTDAKSVRLHFEIRHNGESVNPLSYLPKK